MIFVQQRLKISILHNINYNLKYYIKKTANNRGFKFKLQITLMKNLILQPKRFHHKY